MGEDVNISVYLVLHARVVRLDKTEKANLNVFYMFLHNTCKCLSSLRT